MQTVCAQRLAMSGSVEVVLICTHSLVFHYAPPQTGERIFCIRCNDMRKVTGGAGDWRANCDSCTSLYITRRTAMALRRMVVKHLHANPEHTVKVWQIGGSEVTLVRLTPGHVLDGIDQEETLPYDH